MDKFIGKLFVESDIILLTGLHIGGSKELGEIGGLDNPVIKNINGIPYIPGSSLKGKIRCLLERKYGVNNSKNNGDPCGCSKCNICLIFGAHSSDNRTISRLIIRDSYLDLDHFRKVVSKDLYDENYNFTETKTENVIDRVRGVAKHPRVIERVPAGAKFKFMCNLSFFQGDSIDSLVRCLIEGLRLLEDDYLGGSGTRGYGHVKFEKTAFFAKNTESYKTNNKKDEILDNQDLSTIKIETIVDNLKNKFK